MAEFDEKTLREIADMTGGAYFNAGSLADFKKVYEKIEKLTETEEEQPDRPLVEELFAPWALAAFLAYALALLLSCTYFMKIP
jgi:Ca-activated chloride channel family protein